MMSHRFALKRQNGQAKNFIEIMILDELWAGTRESNLEKF